METVENVVIVGAACAGYTSAIYTARAFLKPLVIVGDIDGGQLSQTSDVENFPGFPEGIQGPELMQKFRAQAERFGARIETGSVTKVDFRTRPFSLTIDEERTVRANSVIIATGASARWLNLPGETRLKGKGVSACATCDGFFFRGKELAVVGGGDSAMEEATFLTRFASKVTIIHRRAEFRATRVMVERAKANPKIAFLFDRVVDEVLGEARVDGLRLRHAKTGEVSTFPCQGLFLGLGHEPNTAVFRGQIDLDEAGFVVCPKWSWTSIEGVFAAGDVRDPRYKQAVSAAGSGCEAAIDCERWLAEHHAG
ncbi:MAG: thioredoxin-disulfide reductase [Candidatus Coatesbacteria bacterium]